jgi:O-antigen/teichoic acid export membrane protein
LSASTTPQAAESRLPQAAESRRSWHLILSAGTNWLTFVAQLTATFFLWPLVIRALGDARYGVWSLAESILAYCTLLDLGIAACVVRDTARFRAVGESDTINRTCSTSLAIFCAIGVVVAVVGVAVAPWLARSLAQPDAAGLPLETPTRAWWFVVVLVAALASSLPLSIFASILDGLERFIAKSVTRLVLLVARIAATVMVLHWGAAGLLELALLHLAFNVAENLALAVLSFRTLPTLRLSPALVDAATFRRVRGYSLDAFLLLIAGRLAYQTDSFVIGANLPLEAITYFAIAARLSEFAKTLLRTITSTLTPGISAMEARGEVAGIRDLYTQAARWVLYLTVPVQLGLLVYGGDFLSLWLRSTDYARASGPTLVVLAAVLCVATVQSVAARVLYGIGRIRLFARVSLLEAIINLGLSLLLVRWLGIVGVALGTALPAVVGGLFAIVYACRQIDLPVRTFAARVVRGPACAGGLLAGVWLILRQQVTPAGWSSLLACLSVGVAVYAGLVAWQNPALVGTVGRVVSRAVGRMVSRVGGRRWLPRPTPPRSCPQAAGSGLARSV